MKPYIVEEIRAGRAYDLVANNYWKMDKEVLKDICLEFIYELQIVEKYGHYNVADELQNNWEIGDTY